MNYILPEDAYHAYQYKEILPYLKIPYEITSQGQWVNIDPNYQIYCDEFREFYEKLKGKNTLDLFMDLLVFSVEHPYISNQILRFIVHEGKLNNIPLVQTNWNHGVSLYFYILSGVVITQEKLWEYYNTDSTQFYRVIKKGPFANYIVDITMTTIHLDIAYTVSLVITLNKSFRGSG